MSGFDEDFFSFHEDVGLSFGLRLHSKRGCFDGLYFALHKRREVQKSRKVSCLELLRTMERAPLQPYLLGYHIRKFMQTMPASK